MTCMRTRALQSVLHTEPILQQGWARLRMRPACACLRWLLSAQQLPGYTAAAHLHALADPLHFARPRHSLGPLMRLLQLPLLVLDASQQPLHGS